MLDGRRIDRSLERKTDPTGGGGPELGFIKNRVVSEVE